jgi:hypothetical protein
LGGVVRRSAIVLVALFVSACAGRQGPHVFNESSHPLTIEITWANGVACPPISIEPGRVLRAQAEGQPPREVVITYGEHESRIVALELNEWIPINPNSSRARPWAAFIVTDRGVQPINLEALEDSPRATLVRKAPSVDVDATGLREAFDRDLDQALEIINSSIAVGQSRQEIEEILAGLHLAFSSDEEKLYSSFYSKKGFPCAFSGILDVTFDKSDRATKVVADRHAMCL